MFGFDPAKWPMILERYFYREIGQTFLGVLAILLLIWLSHRFAAYLADAAAGEFSADLILELVLLKLVANLSLLLPSAFFFAVLLGLGRMYRDSEVVAMMAAGISPVRLFRAMLWVSFGFAVLVAALSLFVGPRAHELSYQVQLQARDQLSLASAFAGRFRSLGDERRVFYAEGISADRKTLSNVFVQIGDRERAVTLSSPLGYQETDPVTGDRHVVLEQGHRYEGIPGQGDFSVTRFERHMVRVPRQAAVRSQRLNAVPSGELIRADDTAWQAELQWRLSAPISLLVLGSLAVTLARTSPREGRYGKLLNAVFIFILYSNLLGLAKESVAQGHWPVAVGVWPVHLAMALLAGLLLAGQTTGGWRPAWRRLRARRRRT